MIYHQILRDLPATEGLTPVEKAVLLHILSEVRAMGLGFYEPEAAASAIAKVEAWAKA